MIDFCNHQDKFIMHCNNTDFKKMTYLSPSRWWYTWLTMCYRTVTTPTICGPCPWTWPCSGTFWGWPFLSSPNTWTIYRVRPRTTPQVISLIKLEKEHTDSKWVVWTDSEQIFALNFNLKKSLGQFLEFLKIIWLCTCISLDCLLMLVITDNLI